MEDSVEKVHSWKARVHQGRGQTLREWKVTVGPLEVRRGAVVVSPGRQTASTLKLFQIDNPFSQTVSHASSSICSYPIICHIKFDTRKKTIIGRAAALGTAISVFSLSGPCTSSKWSLFMLHGACCSAGWAVITTL